MTETKKSHQVRKVITRERTKTSSERYIYVNTSSERHDKVVVNLKLKTSQILPPKGLGLGLGLGLGRGLRVEG